MYVGEIHALYIVDKIHFLLLLICVCTILPCDAFLSILFYTLRIVLRCLPKGDGAPIPHLGSKFFLIHLSMEDARIYALFPSTAATTQIFVVIYACGVCKFPSFFHPTFSFPVPKLRSDPELMCYPCAGCG